MIIKFNTQFPLEEKYLPKYYILDASNQILGRFSTLASNLLRGKKEAFYTEGVDLGNFLIVINANKIIISGKKKIQKKYYRNSQRPGSLKQENFLQLKNRIPSRIIEKSIWGMLPKNILGRNFYRRLFIYPENVLDLHKNNIFNVKLTINDYIFITKG